MFDCFLAFITVHRFDSFVPYCSTWSSYCRDYFNSVAHSFIHLFILVTTANFPDVMNPYTECNGWAFLFFAAYIVLSLYTFLSLVLAVVYNLYQRIAAAQVARRRAKSQRSIWKAYVCAWLLMCHVCLHHSHAAAFISVLCIILNCLLWSTDMNC